MGELELRELRREDLDLVRGLYEATKNRLRAEEYDRWRFFDTPWGDSPAVIAVDGDVCAALYIVWPAMLRLGGEDVLGAQSMDTMTHPDYRGRGLFVAAAEKCFAVAKSRGIEVVYGFPNANSYPGFVRRLDFDHVGDVRSWSASSRVGRLFGRRAVARAARPRRHVSIEQLDLAELEPLFARWLDEKDLSRVRRDAAWLTWRYSAPSGELYEWFTVRNEAGALTAAVLSGERDAGWAGYGSGELRIHEAFSVSDDARTDAFRAVVRHARDRGLTDVRMLAMDVGIERSLSAAGFGPREPYPLIVRKLVSRRLPANVHHLPAWRIIGGDMDSF